MTDLSMKVVLSGDISDYNREMLKAAAGTEELNRQLGATIDQLANFSQQTQGVQNFLSSVSQEAPTARSAFGDITDAMLKSADAAALFKKSSENGAVQAAKDLPAATRAYLDFGAALGSAGPKTVGFDSTSQRLGASLKGAGKLAGGAAGLAFAMSDLDEKMGLANTTMGVMTGAAFGPWGAAIGGGIGLIMDLTSQTDDSAESVKRWQQAFAGATTLEDQAAVIAQGKKEIAPFKKMQKGGLDFFDDDIEKMEAGLEPLIEQYEAGVRAAQDLKFEEAGMGNALRDASDDVRDQTEALIDNNNAHNLAADTALGGRAAQRRYKQAVDDAADAAKANGKTLNTNTSAGRRNQAALDNLAASWNSLGPAAQGAKGASAKAREEFVKVARAMGMGKEAAEKLAGKLLDIPSVKPKVRVDDRATEILKGIKKWRDQLKDKDVTITTTLRRVISEAMTPPGSLSDRGNEARAANRADGGYITGPGGPRDDLIPAMLSNGEFVINAHATSRNLGLLHAINAQKFADGGAVQRMPQLTYSGGGGGEGAPISASLSGARIAISKDGFATFIDGRIEMAIAGQNNYAASNRRAGR